MISIFNEQIEKEFPLNKKRAKIVTIEGIDGSGKTTLVENCVKELKAQGFTAAHISTSSNFNGYWAVVKKGLQEGIITKDTNQMLHNIAFLTYLNTLFINELNSYDYVFTEWYIYGKMVLSECYTNSAHSLSKDLLCLALNAQDIILPDFSFFLDVPPEEALKRIVKRNGQAEEKESIVMLQRASEIWERYVREYNITRLNGLESEETLKESVLKRIL